MKITDRYSTVLRCYDNGGRTVDRYTILPPRWAKEYRERNGLWSCIGTDDTPFRPQGIGMHVSAAAKVRTLAAECRGTHCQRTCSVLHCNRSPNLWRVWCEPDPTH